MTTMANGWTPRERALLLLCVASLGISIAGYLDLGGTAGGAPRGGGGGVGSSVTSGEIRNGTIRSADIGPTIRSVDIVDGSLRARDLNLYVKEGFGSPGTIGAGVSRHDFITCDNPGDRVISGGFEPRGPNQGLLPVGSAPVRAGTPVLDQWHFDFRNVGQTEVFYAYRAICLDD